MNTKIGAALEGLDKLIDDQESYATAVRKLITDLDLEIGEEGMADDDPNEMKAKRIPATAKGERCVPAERPRMAPTRR